MVSTPAPKKRTGHDQQDRDTDRDQRVGAEGRRTFSFDAFGSHDEVSGETLEARQVGHWPCPPT